jgi:hypothetical protein
LIPKSETRKNFFHAKARNQTRRREKRKIRRADAGKAEQQATNPAIQFIGFLRSLAFLRANIPAGLLPSV